MSAHDVIKRVRKAYFTETGTQKKVEGKYYAEAQNIWSFIFMAACYGRICDQRKISRAIGVPLTKSGRQRKIGRFAEKYVFPIFLLLFLALIGQCLGGH